jgi:replicative superfamily II helicase
MMELRSRLPDCEVAFEGLKGEVANVGSAPPAAEIPARARSNRVSDRAVEELKRRIKTLEQTQEQAAQMLARETEGRLRAEKFLAAADKRQEDAANYLESAKQEIRKEIQASFKQLSTESDEG